MDVTINGAVIFTFDPDRWDKAPDIIDGIVRRWLNEFGKAMVKWIKDRVRSDSKSSEKSVKYRVVQEGQYIYFLEVYSDLSQGANTLEYGRKGGTPPPAFFGWVSRRSIVAPARKERGSGSAVGRKGKKFVMGRRSRKGNVKRSNVQGKQKKFDEVLQGTMTSQNTRAAKDAAYMIMKSIAKHGTKLPPPHLFSRAFYENQDVYSDVIRRVVRDIENSV